MRETGRGHLRRWSCHGSGNHWARQNRKRTSRWRGSPFTRRANLLRDWSCRRRNRTGYRCRQLRNELGHGRHALGLTRTSSFCSPWMGRGSAGRGCGRRTGWTVKVEVEGLVLESDGQGFRIQIKTTCIKLLESRFSQGNPFAELRLYVVNAKPRHSVQVEITTKLNVLRMIHLLLRSLRNIIWTETRSSGNRRTSLSIPGSGKRSSPNAILPKHKCDERG